MNQAWMRWIFFVICVSMIPFVKRLSYVSSDCEQFIVFLSFFDSNIDAIFFSAFEPFSALLLFGWDTMRIFRIERIQSDLSPNIWSLEHYQTNAHQIDTNG